MKFYFRAKIMTNSSLFVIELKVNEEIFMNDLKDELNCYKIS
jgi:hypothetical protein